MSANVRLAKARAIASEMQRLQQELDALHLSEEEANELSVSRPQPALSKSEQEVLSKLSRRPLKSAREQVLSAVQEVGLPMLSRDIQHYLRTVHGISVDATRFGSLRKAEMDAFDRGSRRTTWITYGLTDKGEAVKRLLSRSDFPLHERVVGALTGRRLFFETTARLCEIALNEREHIANFDDFSVFVADHARDIPGVDDFKKGQFQFAYWLEKSKLALAAIAERDLSERKHIAMRLTMLSEKDRFFGTEFAAEDRQIQPPITAETFAR